MEEDLFYKPGEEVFIGSVPEIGLVTDSTKQIQFAIHTPKRMDKISSVAITAGTMTVRGISGYVQDSYNTPIKLANGGYTVTANKRDSTSLSIYVDKSSEFSNAANNTPVVIITAGLKLKFS